MALTENIDSDHEESGRAPAGGWLRVLHGSAERRLRAALAGKPERLLRDMGVDPATIGAPPWTYELGGIQAIGNRP